MKTVTYKQVSTIAMVEGGEETHPTVVHNGTVKDWVGFGWVDMRKATEADQERYPTVVGGES